MVFRRQAMLDATEPLMSQNGIPRRGSDDVMAAGVLKRIVDPGVRIELIASPSISHYRQNQHRLVTGSQIQPLGRQICVRGRQPDGPP